MKVKLKNNKYLLPTVSVIGLIFGITIGSLIDAVAVSSLGGGVLHPFPADFSIVWLYKALLTELIPVLLIYLGGFGFLYRQSSTVAVVYRTVLSGFTLTLLYRQLSGEIALYLYIFICLADCVTIGVLLSMSRLSALFFNSMIAEYRTSKIKRYTTDMLFFVGLLVLFYFIKGCIMTVLFHTV